MSASGSRSGRAPKRRRAGWCRARRCRNSSSPSASVPSARPSSLAPVVGAEPRFMDQGQEFRMAQSSGQGGHLVNERPEYPRDVFARALRPYAGQVVVDRHLDILETVFFASMTPEEGELVPIGVVV